MNRHQLTFLVMAMDFAARKHRDQRRRDHAASPYINHPIALLRVLVVEASMTDLDTIAAALLHDTVEDTDTHADEIEAHFGVAVRRIVEEVTDDKRLDKAQRKRAQVERAPGLSSAARAVKLADKICNLRDIVGNPPAGWDLERRQAYFDWAREVVDALRGDHAALESLFDEAYRQRPQS